MPRKTTEKTKPIDAKEPDAPPQEPSGETAPKPDQTCSLILRVVLTDTEVREKSRALADKATKLNQLEEDKKRASSHFGSEIKEARGEITKLSQLVTTGYELRDVPCEVWFHRPKPGQKTTIRTDTGESVNVTMMSSLEMQMRLPIQEEAPATAVVPFTLPEGENN
jgi:hypothetical protein